VPGYEPFLLCDFHVHTRWSDGRLTLREVVDLYGGTGRFDVIAITDHILMKHDLLARAGRLATLGRRNFGVDPDARPRPLAGGPVLPQRVHISRAGAINGPPSTGHGRAAHPFNKHVTGAFQERNNH
jgi:hypothetical protein